ncbi:MAG: S-methyl-5'-thioadenosine phosphorylase, partial [Candidatus Bathyarchaeia archaeon]
PGATHVSMADPYCPELRDLVIKTCSLLDLATHPLGTVVVIQGPRFSTRAESRWFRESGWQVINMTQYPEVNLAREQEICYCNVSLVTDYDVWAHEPVSAEEVTKLLRQNIDKLKGIIKTAVPEVPKSRGCACSRALQSAKI